MHSDAAPARRRAGLSDMSEPAPAAPPLERPAAQLWPGDLLRYDGELYRCARVTVSPDGVAIEADRFAGGHLADRRVLALAPAQLVRVPLTGAADNVSAAISLTA